MENIKEVEYLLGDWKAALMATRKLKNRRAIKYFKGGVKALESALEILKRPSNKDVEDRQAKCICTPNGVQVKCPVHGFTGGFVSPPAT